MGGLRWFLIACTAAVTVFLLVPLVFIVALSFGSSQWLIFPPPGWTLRWYGEFFGNPAWLGSIATSAEIAAIVTVCSVGLGLLSSFALVRGSFPGRAALRALFLTPMVLPVVVFAVAIYGLFLKIGFNGTLLGFVIAHTIVALPLSIISISTALQGFDKSIEDAAILCGANPWEARWRVTLPAIRLGLFSAAIFSFLVSWDEVVVAIFMASPTLQTLPVKIWSSLRQDLSPVIAAASTLLIASSILLMAVVALLRRAARNV
jgi:putative spermidine/putrescine transport system permease protein